MDSKNEIRYRLRSRRDGEGVDLMHLRTGESELGCESTGIDDLLLVVLRVVLEGV